MRALILQVQLLLTALGALLPLVPAAARKTISAMLDVAGQALRIGDAATQEIDDLAAKLTQIRKDVEQMVEHGEHVSADRLDEAWARVAAASAAFRAAAQDS